MPATRRNRMRSSKTMRGGKKEKKNLNAEAKHFKVDRFIHGSLKDIGKAADLMSGVFQAYGLAYYKDFGLAPAKKKAQKIFDDLEKLEGLVKKSKYYNKDASSSPM